MSIKNLKAPERELRKKTENIVRGILAGRKSESYCTWWHPHVVTTASCVESCVQKPRPLVETHILLLDLVKSCLMAAQNTDIKPRLTDLNLTTIGFRYRCTTWFEILKSSEQPVVCFPVNPSVPVLLQDLADDLSSELSGNYCSVVLGLLMLAPVYDAYELKSAMKVRV